ncbi:MAG: hypothetical protein GY861_07395 [bacterium]|nr:hypothetical protein [bacterium]
MTNKKGVIELQVKWIYVLIAGSLILLFFVGLAQQTQSIAEKKEAETLLRNLEKALSNPQLSSDSAQQIHMPVEMTYDSESFRAGKVYRTTDVEPIFAPDVLKGNTIITWTREWNRPFETTNFVYVTTDDVRYVFVYDGPGTQNEVYAREYCEKMYEHVLSSDGICDENKDLVEYSKLSMLSGDNSYQVKFVFFGSPDKGPLDANLPSWVEDMKEGGVHAVWPYSKTLTGFYKYRNNKFVGDGDSYYHLSDSASVYAAIFSGNREIFDKNMEKAFTRLYAVASVYEERTNELKMNVPSTDCKDYYTSASSYIGIIKDKAEKKASGKLLNAYALDIGEKQLKIKNQQLIENSCPTIY